MLTIDGLNQANLSRVKGWHGEEGLGTWSALEWAGAMAGEAGEACNAAKKLKRIEDSMMNINESARSLLTLEDANLAVAREVADTIIYGLLLIVKVGHDPEHIIREVFNQKSEEYGFDERV